MLRVNYCRLQINYWNSIYAEHLQTIVELIVTAVAQSKRHWDWTRNKFPIFNWNTNSVGWGRCIRCIYTKKQQISGLTLFLNCTYTTSFSINYNLWLARPCCLEISKKNFPRNWNNFINFNMFNLAWMFSDNLSMSVFAKNLFQGKQQQYTIPFSKKTDNFIFLCLHQFMLHYATSISFNIRTDNHLSAHFFS